MRNRELVLTTWIDCLNWSECAERITAWVESKTSRVVCICNVHSVVTARTNTALREAINQSDIATPDGMPLAWLISKRRGLRQERINGPDLTVRVCEMATQRLVKVGFYGSSVETLEKLQHTLLQHFPQLEIACTISPPFRPLSADEDAALVKRLRDSGAGIVFVGLGCPKQEIWMATHQGQVNSVMIGVGAAFDYIAENVKRPPLWMQRAGLEWLGRLIAEPRRLWRRYLVTNTIFLLYILAESVGLIKPPSP